MALAVDLYRRRRPPADLDDALAAYAATNDESALIAIDEGYQFLQSEDVPWTSKPDVALVGLDIGGRFALLYAFDNPAVRSVVVAYTPLGGDEDRSRPLAAVPTTTRCPSRASTWQLSWHQAGSGSSTRVPAMIS